jgi:hypothetical protein
VYSKKVRAGKRRTYFFDVRRTKGDDFYLTLTESTKKFEGNNFERHKIFLYKEDFNRFLTSLEEVIEYIKTELMPDYDYEEFDRKEAEWDARRAEEGDDGFRGGGNRRERSDDNARSGGNRRQRNDDNFHSAPKRNYRADDDDNNLEEVNDDNDDHHHEDDDMSW